MYHPLKKRNTPPFTRGGAEKKREPYSKISTLLFLKMISERNKTGGYDAEKKYLEVVAGSPCNQRGS
jgi:hypothetical protein